MAAILVIEDDAAIAEMLRTTLEEAGHRAIVVYGLEAARSALATADLVIADIGLPDGSGLDIAGDAAAVRIPVLLTTGHPEHMAQLEAERRAYLRKPFRVRDLQQRVAELLAIPRAASGAVAAFRCA
jgi:DNA-binding response OmpR family regulator